MKTTTLINPFTLDTNLTNNYEIVENSLNISDYIEIKNGDPCLRVPSPYRQLPFVVNLPCAEATKLPIAICINLPCAEATSDRCGKTKENLEEEEGSGECSHDPTTCACSVVHSTWFRAPVCSCHACLAWYGGSHLPERAAMRQHESQEVLPHGDHPNHHGHPQPQLQHQLQLCPFFTVILMYGY